MTRRNRSKSKEIGSSSTNSIDHSTLNFPDLSTFRDEEKQHILNVLQRDENLRNKHLSRFTNLRKEVANLEHQSQAASSSICARCQTPFGYIFNTGDTCPKCGTKVCKQCRLLYNVHDNGWLCQLCCKQMQLMSYSGEWLYTTQNNLGKGSIVKRQSSSDLLPFPITTRASNRASTSESEPEDLNLLSVTNNRSKALLSPNKSKSPNSHHRTDRMMIQSEADEQKLNTIKANMKKRPLELSLTQPLPRRIHQLTLPSNTSTISSEQLNSSLSPSNHHKKQLFKRQNVSQSKNVDVVKSNTDENLKPKRSEVDVRITIAPESTRNKVQGQRSLDPSSLDVKPNSSCITSEKSSGKHLSVSMQNLRDVVHRISQLHQSSSSRTSLTSEKKCKSAVSSVLTINDDDSASLKKKQPYQPEQIASLPVMAYSYGQQQIEKY